jgi:hypothetical protein
LKEEELSACREDIDHRRSRDVQELQVRMEQIKTEEVAESIPSSVINPIFSPEELPALASVAVQGSSPD